VSSETAITKENLDHYLKTLAKEFRKLNGKSSPAELILIGGASILSNYGFREVTYDVDAIIAASSAMRQAANNVGDMFGLQNGWLNMDFKKTCSYSDKLVQFSVYYRTYSNVLAIRTITGEYLIAMKLMAGRDYKYDLSDVVGIFWEHEKTGKPITREAIDKAMNDLYGGWEGVSEDSKKLLDEIVECVDYEKFYKEVRASEIETKEVKFNFIKTPPVLLKESNIEYVIKKAREKIRKDISPK